MIKEQQWEEVPQDRAVTLLRMKVPGGWLLMITDDVMTYRGNGVADVGFEWRSGVTFYPDPKHEWLKEGKEPTA